MPKIIVAVLISLFAGFALALWITGNGDVEPVVGEAAVDNLQPIEERMLSLEQLIAEERGARLDLEDRLNLLIEREEETAPSSSAVSMADDDAAAERRQPQRRSRDFVALMRNFEERRLLSLMDNGFSEDEARRVIEKESEAEFMAMQAAWEAQRGGESVDPLSAMGDYQALLRAELGDADYERYLAAQGQPTSIQVTRVLAGSPGSDAGLQPGDQLVSYAGERVYNVSDLRKLTLQGTPGEDVVIEIDRDGVRMQLNVQRGPVGISGAGARMRNMNWFGGG
jgi:membrane-associated protease RseP (regulator of RpoE activity)